MVPVCVIFAVLFFFFKQKTAYEMRISDWSSDVCSSDLPMERSPMAIMPASTPGPTMVTSISAQMSELMEREETMMKRATGLTSVTLGVVLRAARKATGTAMMIASKVPSVAMLMEIGRASCRERVCQYV